MKINPELTRFFLGKKLNVTAGVPDEQLLNRGNYTVTPQIIKRSSRLAVLNEETLQQHIYHAPEEDKTCKTNTIKIRVDYREKPSGILEVLRRENLEFICEHLSCGD